MQIKSKGKEISYEQLEMQNYLKADSDLNLEEKKMAFKLRTRMTDIKMNMQNKHKILSCDACETKNEINNETQEHIYICRNIKSGGNVQEDLIELFFNKRCNLKLKEIVKTYQKILKEREKIVIEKNKTTENNKTSHESKANT